MNFVKQGQRKDFVRPLRTNRKIALSAEDKDNGKYVTLEVVNLELDSKIEIYLEGVTFPFCS